MRRPVSIAVLALAAFGALQFYYDSVPTSPNSVEIGLAETSPLGESGGFAVPASGCSPGDIKDDLGNVCPVNWCHQFWTILYFNGNTIQKQSIKYESNPDVTHISMGATAQNNLQNNYSDHEIMTSYDASNSFHWSSYYNETDGGVFNRLPNILTQGGSNKYGIYNITGVDAATFELTAKVATNNDRLITHYHRNLNNPACFPATDPVTVDLIAPLSVPYGSNVNLSWTTNFADSCVGDWPTSNTNKNPNSGSSDVFANLTAPHTFTILCSNSQPSVDNDSETVTITYPDPTITANPEIIRQGDATTLTWDPVGPYTDCSVTPRIGPVIQDAVTGLDEIGSDTDTPSSETTYVISCASGNVQDSVTVQVLPVIQET